MLCRWEVARSSTDISRSNSLVMALFLNALSIQVRVIQALVYRETLIKLGNNKIGFLSAIGQSLSQILFLSLLFTVIGRNNPIGGSIVLFLATAVIPYNFCIIMATKMMTNQGTSKSLMTHSFITPFDTIIANLIIESTILLLAGVVIFTGVGLLGYWDYSYDSLIDILLMIIVSITLGFAIGLINAALAARFSLYPKFWGILTRPLFLTSGVFFVASERFPPEVMAFLYYNPVLHITEWSRSAFYRTWESSLVDLKYLLGFTLTALFIGLVMQRLTEEKARE